MKISLNWLNDYVSLRDISHEELKKRFTNQSQEVEGLYPLTTAKNIVVGEVVSCEPHPDADKLSVCNVDVKEETLQIICGAPNVAAGQKVIVALPGAVLPGDFKIKVTTIRGVESSGMICSLKELGIEEKYHQETGIHVLPEDAPVGEEVTGYTGLDDYVLELDLTPNRPDLLSMRGAAFDVGAMFDIDITLPRTTLNVSDMKNDVTVESTTDNCKSYYARIIDNVSIAKSPLWLRSRLIAAGIRPINNVVDITNYVMLETGQPLHAFDYDKLNADRIVVRMAKDKEPFTTLDDKQRILNEDDILITDGKNPIALGGVMGGAETEVGEKTTSILLESATFNPVNIRRTSRRLALSSEASMRFERGVDPAMTKEALDRASDLLMKFAGATVRENIRFIDEHDHVPKPVHITMDKITRVLGADLSEKKVEDIFRRLAFDYELKDGRFTVAAPTRRQDITTYQDIIEEIGRIHDYNTLPDTLPKTVSKGGLTDYQSFKRRIRRTLTGLSLNETITYSLVADKSVFDLTPHKDANPVKIANPISEERTTLVLTPLNGLLEVARYNIARRQTAVHAFELSKRYTEEKETEVLGLLMMGPYRDHLWQETPPTDFFTLKGVIGALAERFNLSSVTYEKITLENYHPHQTARIRHKGEPIGFIGKLHPEYAHKYGLEEVFLAEMDLEKLYAHSEKLTRYEKVLKYPSVSRDIALVVDETINAGAIIASIKDNSTGILKDAYVFDVYQGEHIESGKKSLAIRLHFEDKTGTLKTKTIDEMVRNILEALKNEHDAILR